MIVGAPGSTTRQNGTDPAVSLSHHKASSQGITLAELLSLKF